ncbi:hypothetical protein V8B55DRAFT_1340321, partial [Mucor lusitanicus]
QIKVFFREHFINKRKPTHAAALTEIPESTGCKYIRDAKLALEFEKETGRMPTKAASSGNQKLFSKHDKYLVDFFKKNYYASMKMTLQALQEEHNILMSEAGLLSHLLKKFCLVLRGTNEGEPSGVGDGGTSVLVSLKTFLLYERH